MTALPETLIISVSDHATRLERYLSFSGPQKFLRCGVEDGVFSLTAKFAVEPVPNGNGLVHIRSCYDNHYWVRASATAQSLSVSAPEPVEDRENDGCTLFRPQMGPGNAWVSFVHLRSGLNVVLRSPSEPFPYNLGVATSAPTQFSYINYTSLIKLPKYVTFWSTDNEMYLIARTDPASKINFQFFDQRDTMDPATGFETFVNRDGDIRVKSRTLDKFWKRRPEDSPDAIWITAENPSDNDDSGDPNTIFELLPSLPPSGINVGLALRCRGNNLFCRRYNVINDRNRLCATTIETPGDPQHHPYACHIIRNLIEPSKSNVTVTQFRHHRILNTTPPQEMAIISSRVFENESENDVQEEFPKDNTPTLRYTFTNSVTHGNRAATFFTRIPFLSEEGQIEYSDDVVELGFRSWGETYLYVGGNNNKSANNALSPVQTAVTVPAKSKVTATLLAKVSTCEFLISYRVSDEFNEGGGDTYTLHDGVFTGEYTYEYNVKIDGTEPLDPASTQVAQAN